MWHNASIAASLAAFETTPEGLSEDEAARRLKELGPNRLPPARGVSAFAIAAAQLRSIVVVLLVAATAVSIAIGDWIEAAAIGAVLVINTVLGFLTEWRARQAMEALLHLQAARYAVVRAGRLHLVDATTLVRGDIVQARRRQHGSRRRAPRARL